MPELDVKDSPSAPLAIAGAAGRPVAAVLDELGSGGNGLTGAEAGRRLTEMGPNAVRTHMASGWSVLGRQLASPILLLLLITAGLSLFLGDATNAIVIGVILLVSVGLGFSNEYRAERAAEALHSRVTPPRRRRPRRQPGEVDVTALVPGDVVHLGSARSSRPTCGC